MQTASISDILSGAGVWKWRGSYSAVVAGWLSALPAGPVLEVGCDTARLVPGSVTMDVRRGGFDVCQDARVAPWPFPSKEFDVVLALEVWEHLHGGEALAFAEASRVGRRVILSVPYLWRDPDTDLKDHVGIDLDRLVEWCCGVRPRHYVIVQSPTCVGRHLVAEWVFGENA